MYHVSTPLSKIIPSRSFERPDVRLQPGELLSGSGRNPVDSRLWSAARTEGMLTMQEDAMLKAFDKKIPFSEVNTLSTLLLAEDDEKPAPASVPSDLPPEDQGAAAEGL